MYQTIDEQQEQKQHNDYLRTHKVTPEMLGLQPTNDYAQFAQQKIIDDDYDKAKAWADKGGIGVLEAGERYAAEFSGDYDNVYTYDQQRKDNKFYTNEMNNLHDRYSARMAKQAKDKAERDKRVNAGTASIADRVLSALDRTTKNVTEGNKEYVNQLSESTRRHQGNPNYMTKLDMNKTLLHGYASYDETDLRTKIGFWEGLSRNGDRAIPFIGGWIHGRGQQKFEQISDKVRNHEQITQEELDYLNDYKDRLYEEQIRGYSIPGLIGADFLPSVLAFGAELWLGGAVLKGLGLAGKGIALGDAIKDGLLNINKLGKTGELLSRATGYTTGLVAENLMNAGVTTALPTSYGNIYATYRERRLNDKMKITDRGTIIFTDAKEKPATAFLKSLQSCYISYFTEGLGGLIDTPVNVLKNGIVGAGTKQFLKFMDKSPALKTMIEKTTPVLSAVYEKLHNLPIKGENIDWLKSKVKFDGFLGEIGEEVLEDILNLTFKTDDEPRTLENYIKLIKRTPEEWAVLTGSIALQGLTLSIGGNLLGHGMEKNGNSPEDIVNILLSSTEDEKQELIDGLIKRGVINIKSPDFEAKRKRIAEEIADRLSTNSNFKDDNQKKKVADWSSLLVSAISEKTGIAPEEIIDKELPSVMYENRNANTTLKGGVSQNVYGDNEFSDADYDAVFDAIDNYNGNNTQAMPDKQTVDKRLKENFNMNSDDMSSMVKSDISNILTENNVSKDEFNLEDVRVYGSYTTGKNKDTSDLDFIVQYSGSMREDDAFNMLHDSGLTLTDNNGVERTIDINPINREQSGTIDEHLGQVYHQAEKGIKPITIDKNSIPNFDKVSDLKNWIFNNLSLLGNITIKDNGRTVFVGKTGLKRSMKDIGRNEPKKDSYIKLKDIIENAIEYKPKTTDERHPNVKGQEIYHNAISFNGKVYGVEISVDIPKTKNAPYNYAGHKIKEIKIAPAVNGVTSNEALPNITDATISINYIRKLFNPNVTNHEGFSYKQTAYNGSPTDHDGFSNDYIGTGEGHQAHGYGMYFAKNKNVSEGYRIGILENRKQSRYLYDGKPIEQTEFSELDNDTLSFISALGKEDTISEIKDDIEYTKKWGEENKNKQSRKTLKGNKEYLKKLEKRLELVEKLDEQKLTFDGGQLFEVDIPEDDVMLDEDKPLSEQPEKIRKAIYEYMKKNPDDFILPKDYNSLGNMTGERFYEEVSLIERRKGAESSGQKEASETLNKLGIEGIKYNGRQDGECYVVFNDKAIKILKKYYQEGDQQNYFRNGMSGTFVGNQDTIDKLYKGEYVPFRRVIKIFESGDESTIIHEFAHWYLDALDKYSLDNEELQQDMEQVRKFLKNDGGEFTVAQHEKFARAFEVYIRNGYAQNNRLRKIFEYFKNALLSIYDNLKKITWQNDDGTEGKFTIEDVPVINDLFNNLLTSERERIQNKVFDKVLEIQDQIDAIRDGQDAELDKLNQLWQKYVANLNRKSDLKRSVEEYLNLAHDAAKKKTKEQKEREKRYKNVIYEILEAATGLPRQTIANPRNQETVEKKIETSDKITAGNGFQKGWGEFFYDPGVSYDNQELNADQQLAWKAYDVLLSRDFSLHDNPEELKYGKDTFTWLREVEYLTDKCQKLKGEEKYKCYEALCELLGEDDRLTNLPEVIAEGLTDNFIKLADTLNEQTAEDFNRRTYPNFNVVAYMQGFISDKLKDLKLYNPETRYKTKLNYSHKLYRLIPGATSVNNAKRIVRQINKAIIEDLQMNQKSLLHKEIQKQVNVKTRIKSGNSYKGKFDWKTNSVFAELQEMNKQSKSSLRAMYIANMEMDKIPDEEARTAMPKENPADLETDNFETKIKRKFANYRSSRLKDLDVDTMTSLLNDLLKLKQIGRDAKDEEDFQKELHKDITKTNLLEILALHQNNKAAKFITKWALGANPLTSEGALANWETILTTLFDKNTAQQFSLLKLESDAEVYAYDVSTKFFKKALQIFNLNNNKTGESVFDKAKHGLLKFYDLNEIQPFVDLLRKYDKTKYTYKEVTWNRKGQFIETQRELSHSQLITIYAWYQNQNLRQRLETQFDTEQLRDMFNRLSDQDKDFAWLMIDTCDSLYDDINRVFVNMTGLTLPKVENYFPSKAVRNCSEIDLMHEHIVRSSNPSYIKSRANCRKIKMDPQSPLDIILPHINKVARHVVMSETLGWYTKIFKGDTTLSTKINEIYGEKAGERIMRTLATQLDSSVYSNYARTINIGKSIVDDIASNFVTAAVGGNLKVTWAQLLSVINYSEDMPTGTWTKGFAHAIAHPKETVKFMWENCRYLQSRFAGNSMNEVMVRVTSETDRFRSLRQFMMTNTKYGDIIAIIFGGKPYVDYLMKEKKMSKEDAFTKFVESTLRAQQSGHNSATSLWQKNMANNAITRMMFAFNNTNLQYQRKWIEALSNFVKSDKKKDDIQQFVKSALIYKVWNPIMFGSFVNDLSILALFNSLAGGGDDDNPFATFLSDCGISIISSMFGGVGFVGMLLTELTRWLISIATQDRYFKTGVPLLGDIQDMFLKLSKKNVSVDDYVSIMSTIGNYTTGLPMERFVEEAGGVSDMAQGDFLKGVTELQGWSDYRTSKALGIKKDKKRKD